MIDYLRNLNIEKKIVGDKLVCVFESHHYALLPWSIVKRDNEDYELNLLSFDHHTDTNDPFLSYVFNKFDGKVNDELVKAIDYHDDASVADAIGKLRNDEHVKTAIKCGIIKHAFIIASEGRETPESYEEKKRIDNCSSDEAIMQQIMGTYRITPKKDRTYPTADIYMPDFEYEGGEDESDVLSDGFVGRHLSELSRISGMISKDGRVTGKYILDIDLDYFHVPEAAEPKEHKVIDSLIKNAEIITIAKESFCVDICSEGRCNSEDLLDKVFRLIEMSV